MMELIEAIKGRRSIRSYSKKTITEDTIERLIDAARLAPSAGNAQPYEIIIAQKEETRQMLSEAAFNQKSIVEVPLVLVVCVDEKRANESYGFRGKTLYCIQDTAAAIQNILLTAYSLGLGSCWIGAFKEEEVKKAINAPVEMRPVAMVPIGYPNESPAPRSRTQINQLAHKETF